MYGLYGIFDHVLSYGIFGVLATAFWVWMLIDCIRNEPDRYWIWIILFLNFPGAVIYFIVRRGLSFRMKPPEFLNQWLRHHDLIQAQAAVKNIGNVHQYVQLGDLLMELGKYERALEIYRQGLARNGKEKPALWGAAQSAMKLGEYQTARNYLEELMAMEVSYRFGEGSLAYGRALVELADYPGARVHLEKHLARWFQPEARVLLARVLKEQAEPDAARKQLEQLLEDYRISPAFNRKQNRTWAWRAKLMLRNL